MGRITDKGDRWHRQAWTATGSSWWGGGKAIDWLDWWCAGCIGECCVMLLLGFRSNPIKTLHGVQPHRIPRPTLGQPSVRQIPLRPSLPFLILSNQPQVSFLIAQMWCGIRSMVLQHSHIQVFSENNFVRSDLSIEMLLEGQDEGMCFIFVQDGFTPHPQHKQWNVKYGPA